MERRAFLAGIGAVLLAAPLAAEGQQAGKVYQIGWLSANSPANAITKSILQNFHQGFRDLGYVEGRDFVMEYRFAEGQVDRLSGLAADLVRAHVDVIVHAQHTGDVGGDAGNQHYPDRFSDCR